MPPRALSDGVRRAELYQLREIGRRYTSNRHVRACGRDRIGGDVTIQRYEGGRCSYGGLAHCGSVWACPVCSARIRAERAGDVQRVVMWHVENQGHGPEGAQLLTLTVRHRFGDELRAMRAGVANAYRRFTRGAPWERFVERVGLIGSVRALEVTHGGNGWHPHLHVVLLVTNPVALEGERAWLAQRWQECVARELGSASEPDAEHGLDVRVCHKVDYLAKLGLEVTAPGAKVGRRSGHRTPWNILADLDRPSLVHEERTTEEIADQHDEDRYLWQTWCEDMKGARMLTWSVGLRERAALGVERTDDEIVADNKAGEVVARIPGAVWDQVRDVPGLKAQLLAAAERGGDAAVHALVALAAHERMAHTEARAA